MYLYYLQLPFCGLKFYWQVLAFLSLGCPILHFQKEESELLRDKCSDIFISNVGTRRLYALCVGSFSSNKAFVLVFSPQSHLSDFEESCEKGNIQKCIIVWPPWDGQWILHAWKNVSNEKQRVILQCSPLGRGSWWEGKGWETLTVHFMSSLGLWILFNHIHVLLIYTPLKLVKNFFC